MLSFSEHPRLRSHLFSEQAPRVSQNLKAAVYASIPSPPCKRSIVLSAITHITRGASEHTAEKILMPQTCLARCVGHPSRLDRCSWQLDAL